MTLIMNFRQLSADIQEAFNVDFKSKKRDEKNVQARRLFVFICEKYLKNKLTYKQIGAEINRHHSTVLHLKSNNYLLNDNSKAFYNYYTNTNYFNIKNPIIYNRYVTEVLSLEKIKCIEAIKSMSDAEVEDFYNHRLTPYLKLKTK